MSKPPFEIRECKCSAITIYSDTDQISMSLETFQKEFPGLGVEPDCIIYNSCNHCVNHWGVDLCECGSGGFPGECHCGSKIAYYDIEPIKSFIWNWIKGVYSGS